MLFQACKSLFFGTKKATCCQCQGPDSNLVSLYIKGTFFLTQRKQKSHTGLEKHECEETTATLWENQLLE